VFFVAFPLPPPPPPPLPPLPPPLRVHEEQDRGHSPFLAARLLLAITAIMVLSNAVR
jgi:hypothetical protein